MTAPWKGLDPDPLYYPSIADMTDEEFAAYAEQTGIKDQLIRTVSEPPRDFGQQIVVDEDWARSRMLGGYLVAAAIVVLAVIAVALLVGRGS